MAVSSSMNHDESVIKIPKLRFRKKLQMQGVQKLRSEAHLQRALQRRSCSATPQMDFLRDHE